MKKRWVSVLLIMCMIIGCFVICKMPFSKPKFTNTDKQKTVEEKLPYISITYGRDNAHNYTGRETVYYTYDIASQKLKEECVIPFDSQYACGVVSRANNKVYYSGNTAPNNDSSGDGLWAYDLETGNQTLLESKNWSYNSVMMLGKDQLLVMAMTKEHPILPALFDLKTKNFIYMPDVNGEPFDLYNCGPTEAVYNYKTHKVICIYQNEKESYTREYMSGKKKIDTYVAVANEDMKKNPKRIYSVKLSINDNIEAVTQISLNKFWLVMDHYDPETDKYTTSLLSLVFKKDGSTELKKIDSPYPGSTDWKTMDGGKTFYFLYAPKETDEKGLYSYCPKNGKLTEILSGDSSVNGHVVNFSILDPES